MRIVRIMIVAGLICFCLTLLYGALMVGAAGSTEPKLDGCLVYANRGKDITSVDLEDLKDQTKYEGRSANVSIEYLTQISPVEFIFDECDALASPNCRLREFDLVRKSVNTLRSGRMPTYVSEVDSVFFYDLSDDDGAQWLYLSKRQSMNTATKIVKAPGRVTLPNGLKFRPWHPVVQVSPSEVVFMGEGQDLWIYNIANNQKRELGVKNKSPEIWIGNSQELIAWDWETKGYYQIDLKIKEVGKISALNRAHKGLVYLPKQDAILFSRSRADMSRSETSDIFMHDLRSKQTKKLVSNKLMSSGFIGKCSFKN